MCSIKHMGMGRGCCLSVTFAVLQHQGYNPRPRVSCRVLWLCRLLVPPDRWWWGPACTSSGAWHSCSRAEQWRLLHAAAATAARGVQCKSAAATSPRRPVQCVQGQGLQVGWQLTYWVWFRAPAWLFQDTYVCVHCLYGLQNVCGRLHKHIMRAASPRTCWCFQVVVCTQKDSSVLTQRVCSMACVHL
jgi:hypothetical protein